MNYIKIINQDIKNIIFNYLNISKNNVNKNFKLVLNEHKDIFHDQIYDYKHLKYTTKLLKFRYKLDYYCMCVYNCLFCDKITSHINYNRNMIYYVSSILYCIFLFKDYKNIFICSTCIDYHRIKHKLNNEIYYFMNKNNY